MKMTPIYRYMLPELRLLAAVHCKYPGVAETNASGSEADFKKPIHFFEIIFSGANNL